MTAFPALGVRWTIGDASPNGFEALRLSIWGAWRLFGPAAGYLVCVNRIVLEEARRRTGAVPSAVAWRPSQAPPPVLAPFVDDRMAEGAAWKLAPLRAFPERYELSLDNDCILWALPAAVGDWLGDPDRRCLLAADVIPAHGAFAALAGPQPRNTGIRGFAPGYDFAGALQAVLSRHPVALASELDEQGLQVAALNPQAPHVVSTDDVSICAPFWPKSPFLGRCGAHFVGLNCRSLPWTYYGRPAAACLAEFWAQHRAELYRRVGLPDDAAGMDPIAAANTDRRRRGGLPPR
jgi:hypothetical protein